MRILLSAVSWLGVIVLPIAIISSVVTTLFFDAAFYHAGEVKYHVQTATGMSQAQMDRVNDGIIRFFGGSESLPQALSASGANPDVFKQKEILHMDDVRVLVQFISKAEIVSIAIMLAIAALCLARWRQAGRMALGRALAGGGILTVILVIVSGILTYTSFDSLFLTFHEVAFTNSFWELDPRTDHLIQMFPFGFWYDAMLSVATRVLIIAVALGVVGVLLRRLKRGKA